jgi:hypothetical protein
VRWALEIKTEENMPPTIFAVIFLIIYIPGFLLVLLSALGLYFSPEKAKYSMPLVLSYIAFPFSQGIAVLTTIPIFLGCIFSMYTAENNLSETGAYYVSIISVSFTGIFFVIASYLFAKKICVKVWLWSLTRWPNGLAK